MKITIIKSDLEQILSQIENKEEYVHLVVMKCNLTIVPKLWNLLLLDLSYNALKSVHDLPPNLMYLNLSHNLISAYGDLSIRENSEIVYLNIDYNPIQNQNGYRNRMLKCLSKECPQLQYLDNLHVKKMDIRINRGNFADLMGYEFELFSDA